MSRHHDNQKWSTHAPKLRVIIAGQLPLPCVNCGNPVFPDQSWQVGHRIDAARGGEATIANTGPSHTSCNRKAGGKLAARITNSKRRAERHTDDDTRPWY
jgi:hypothetical protein